ncbi:MAG: TonB-dependent receptor, partial [Pseudomonadota bacterium]
MKLTLYAGVSAAALVCGVAAAQVPTDDPDTIIVKGQKREVSIDQVTSSVDVITGAEIAREPLINLFEITDRIPNVNTAFGGQGFVVRGIDQRGAGGSTLTVTVFVDDSPLTNATTTFGPLDSWDLGQVEVYRGPQSTNFGRNSIAGAIYMRTQDPTYETDVKARVEVGENGIFQGSAAIGGGIIADKLAFRASFSHRESDGFIKNTFLNEDADAMEMTSGRLKFLFEPTDDISVISTSYYAESSGGEDFITLQSADGVTPLPLADASDISRTVEYNIPGSEGSETFIQSINASWDLTEQLTLTSITTYQDSDNFRTEDFSIDQNNPDDNEAIRNDGTGSDETFTQELRVAYEGERLSGALGLYYLDAEAESESDIVLTGAILDPSLDFVIVSRDGTASSSVTNMAVFLDGEFK